MVYLCFGVGDPSIAFVRLLQDLRLKVKVLDMYLKENKVSVPKNMRKKGKLEIITADIARAIIGRPVGNADVVAVQEDDVDGRQRRQR